MGLEKALGSPMALSLASTNDLPMTVVGLAAGGVILTVSAGVYLYDKFELYEEKKHRKEIEEINHLWKRFLEKIVVPGFEDIQGLPPIFKLTSNENSAAADFLHFTDDQIRDIGKNLPHSADIALLPYRESLLSALLKLQEYYFTRDDRKDLTSAVISYLLYFLFTKCMNFQGYDYDIAYLEAITQFVNAYASRRGEVNSQHFTRLQPVYNYLLSAKKYLEKHKEALSLEELLSELRDSCSNASNKLLRNLVKMTIDKDYAHLSETVALDELQRNILRRRYVSSQIKGIEILPDFEINLPESVFKAWIIHLAQFYIKSLRPISSIKENTVIAPEELFSFIAQAKSILEEPDRSKVQPDDLKQIEKELHLIYKIFKSSPNFINTQLDPDSSKPRFITVHEQKEILNRTTLIAQFARLIHSIIATQYLCTHLLKSIKQLGDIYAKDPNHFREIFGALNQLMTVIKNGVNANLNAFKEIEDASFNEMRLDTEELFSREIVNTLKTVKQMTKNLGGQVMEYRNKKNKEGDPTEASVNYEMRAVAGLITKMYPDVEQPLVYSTSSNPDKINSNTPTPTQENLAEELHRLTSRLFNTIKLIQEEPIKDPNSSQYLSIYRSLNALQTKAILLAKEVNPSTERREKSTNLGALTLSLCQKTLDFLSQKPEDRLRQVAQFVQGLHNELNHPLNNAYIDKHSNVAAQYLHSHFGLFNTDTRNKLLQLEQACAQISASII